MFVADYAIFLGKEEEGFITEFIVKDDFYLVFTAKNHLTKEETRSKIKAIGEIIDQKKPRNLLEFKAVINEEIKKIIKEEAYSCACGWLGENILYLLTFGEGEIYLKRDDKMEMIINGNNSASGYVRENDFFIFTAKNFSLLIDKKELKEKLTNQPVKEIVEELTPLLKEKNDAGVIAVFIRFSQEKEEFLEEKEEVEISSRQGFAVIAKFKNFLASFSSKFFRYQTQVSPNKKLTFIAAGILFLVLIWSVGFGYQRRVQSEIAKKVKAYQEKINQKLNEAVDLSPINLPRSMTLLSEAKADLNELKRTLGKKNIKEIKELDELISAKEKQIVKKEEKKYEEFYDLTLIAKNAYGIKMYLDKDEIVVLNPEAGEIYQLSLTKKSNRLIKGSEIKKASLVALYNGQIFFYQKEKGIYQIKEGDKINLVVKKDDDWGDLVDFWIYNGNLYLLDKTKDEIYKYLVAEGGFSNKTSYFKSGQAIDLNEANSIAIDSSLYIATNNNVYKYTAGVREEFKVDLPEKDGSAFTKVFTDKNSNKIYLWEKNKGRVYFLNKDGEYERQIDSNIFSQAADFVVLEAEKNIYVLVKEKIYKVGLE